MRGGVNLAFFHTFVGRYFGLLCEIGLLAENESFSLSFSISYKRLKGLKSPKGRKGKKAYLPKRAERQKRKRENKYKVLSF